MKKKGLKLLLICICMLAAGICYRKDRSGAEDGSRTVFILDETAETKDEKPQPAVQENAGQEDVAKNKSEVGIKAESEPGRIIYVHVCGEVVSPGVYSLPEGSRICQAVEAAGGFTDSAARDFLNMAQCAEDGGKVFVPDRAMAKEMRSKKGNETVSSDLAVYGWSETDESSESFSDKVNLNTATKEQLMTLKGIGESRAEDILLYRKECGPFGAIEDIMKVQGIKEAAFRKIKDKITV